ncbi:MAG: MipA/OmpV family protein [Burkholderiaceae bacterium]
MTRLPSIAAALAVAAVAAGVLAPAARAQSRQHSLPVWEAGVGVGTFTVPDYRGSDERRGYVLPFPYLVYRGDWLKLDREGLRARLFDNERLDLELSAAATFALRADRNRAREGMPALRTIAEVGPELVYRVLDPRTAPVALDLRLSARAAIELGGGVHHQGWTASPSIRMVVPDVAGAGFDGMVSLGALYGSRAYHAYFYGVDDAYARPDRPAYSASGGFGGWQLILGSSRRIGDWWIGGYLRVDSLSGAAFADSPLVKTDRYVTAGIAVAYVIGKSGQRVMAPR